MLPIYREREVRFITQQTNALSSSRRRSGVASTTRRCARTARLPRARRARVRQVAPEGDPPPLPLFVPAADDASAPVRWIFYLGHHRRSEGRGHADPTVRPSADDWWPRHHRRGRVRPRLPVHAHRRADVDLHRADDRVPARVQRNVRARGDDPDPARGRPDARRCGHAVPHGVSRRAAPAAEG